MKYIFSLFCVLFISAASFAQQQTNPYPLGQYDEMDDSKPFDDVSVWNKMKTATCLSWGSIDVRYKKKDVPTIQQQNRFAVKAWKGERVNAQAVLWTKENLNNATIAMSALKCGSSVIPASDVTTSFVRYVMTDPINYGPGSGCGVP